MSISLTRIIGVIYNEINMEKYEDIVLPYLTPYIKSLIDDSIFIINDAITESNNTEHTFHTLDEKDTLWINNSLENISNILRAKNTQDRKSMVDIWYGNFKWEQLITLPIDDNLLGYLKLLAFSFRGVYEEPSNDIINLLKLYIDPTSINSIFP